MPRKAKLVFVALAWFGAPSAVAAAPVDDAATELAEQLVEGFGSTKPGRIMVAPFRLPDGDAAVATLPVTLAAVMARDHGLDVIDHGAVQKALEERSLSQAFGREELGDAASALGAETLIVGEIETAGGTYHINARVIGVADGTVLAAAKTILEARPDAASPDAGETEATSLVSQLRRLADRVVAGLDEQPGELRYQHVAVFPFEELGTSTSEKQLGRLVEAELTTMLRRDHGLLLIERSQLGRVLEEMALGQSGVVDPASAAEAGRIAGAQLLIIGSVAEAGGQYRVNARVVDAQTAQIQATAETSLPAGDLVALSSEAVVLRTRTGALYRSLLLPGWGQLYNRQPVKGGIFLGLELLSAGLAGTFGGLALNADKDYEGLDGGADFDAAVERRQDLRNWRNIFLWTTLIVHVVNIADAFLSGYTYDPTSLGLGASGASLFQF
jgi:TolB-like protein